MLSKEDLGFILTSLEYTKKNFREYVDYPSPEFKQQRMKEVNDIIKKVREIKNGI